MWSENIFAFWKGNGYTVIGEMSDSFVSEHRERKHMAGTIGIGHQDFEVVREKGYFYIDKTKLIREWWESGDSVTLITRPRRFGKTLNMSMLEKFFSVKYAGRGELFEGLSIWEEEKYRELQGTYPVLFLSFASVKETDYTSARRKICQLIADEYIRHAFLLEEGGLQEAEKEIFLRKTIEMEDVDATLALHQLSCYLSRYYDKKVIILLDEYDTPCRKRMSMDIGRSLWHLPEVCLMPHLRLIHIWNALL